MNAMGFLLNLMMSDLVEIAIYTTSDNYYLINSIVIN